MPLLTRNWFEKSTSEEGNRAELLLLTSGPMVPTQEAGKIYTKEKNLFLGLAEENLKKQKSSHIFNVLSRHLNVAQFFLHGKGYIVESYRHSNAKIVDL